MTSASSGIVAAGRPPPGISSNFTNPESIGHKMVAVAISLPVITGCFLGLRLYTANVIIKRWHRDDYLIIAAYACGLANSIVNAMQTRNGVGNHIWDVPVQNFREFMKLGAIGGSLTYNLSTAFTKASILAFFLRFAIADRALRYAVYFVAFVTIGYSTPVAFAWIYQCQPIALYWDRSLTGSCINIQAMYNASCILNTVTDLAVLVLPIWILRHLHIPLSKKIGVTLILMTGGFVCGVSAARTVNVLLGYKNPDLTWLYSTNLIWFMAEMYVGIICACLPSLRPFFKHHFPSFDLFGHAEKHLQTWSHGGLATIELFEMRRGPSSTDRFALPHSELGLYPATGAQKDDDSGSK
ncbi:Rhodopsin domain-containing protein [Madurella fahalii]|uniref:Rhodopsin domain-containing protein n=1 Tax=Madurella fahalii TaxID=1157608 RepID=A0ABQ0GJT1_9PEZI